MASEHETKIKSEEDIQKAMQELFDKAVQLVAGKLTVQEGFDQFVENLRTMLKTANDPEMMRKALDKILAEHGKELRDALLHNTAVDPEHLAALGKYGADEAKAYIDSHKKEIEERRKQWEAPKEKEATGRADARHEARR
jgi:hypothetical protein